MTGLSAAVKIHSCSWHEMHRDATDLAVRLRARGSFHGIIAIARGGLVPAAIIARVLDVRLIETLCITSYDGQVKGPLLVLKTDSGSTVKAARRMLPLAHYTTLYAKPAGRPFVDTYLREVAQDVWIDFPWDRAPAKAV